MCGIMGFIGKAKTEQAQALGYQLATALLAETASRGHHATGVWAVIPKPEGSAKSFIYKLDASAEEFIKTDPWKGVKQKSPSLLIGHCRHYTHGSPEDHLNNHPHLSADRRLALVHNGVISNYTTLKNRFPCVKDCDSEVILRIIESEKTADSKVDVVKGITKAFDETSGSMACFLGCYDKDQDLPILYTFRNASNPTVMLDLREQWGQIFYASTPDIMKAAMKKSALPSDIMAIEPTSVEDSQIWCIDARTMEFTKTKVTTKTYSGKNWDEYGDDEYYRGARSGYNGYNGNHCSSTTTTSSSTTTSALQNAKINKEDQKLLDQVIDSVCALDLKLMERAVEAGKDKEVGLTEAERSIIQSALEKLKQSTATTISEGSSEDPDDPDVDAPSSEGVKKDDTPSTDIVFEDR